MVPIGTLVKISMIIGFYEESYTRLGYQSQRYRCMCAYTHIYVCAPTHTAQMVITPLNTDSPPNVPWVPFFLISIRSSFSSSLLHHQFLPFLEHHFLQFSHCSIFQVKIKSKSNPLVTSYLLQPML